MMRSRSASPVVSLQNSGDAKMYSRLLPGLHQFWVLHDENTADLTSGYRLTRRDVGTQGVVASLQRVMWRFL